MWSPGRLSTSPTTGIPREVPRTCQSRYGGFHKWGTQEWMVYNGKPHLEMDDLSENGVPPSSEWFTIVTWKCHGISAKNPVNFQTHRLHFFFDSSRETARHEMQGEIYNPHSCDMFADENLVPTS